MWRFASLLWDNLNIWGLTWQFQHQANSDSGKNILHHFLTAVDVNIWLLKLEIIDRLIDNDTICSLTHVTVNKEMYCTHPY